MIAISRDAASTLLRVGFPVGVASSPIDRELEDIPEALVAAIEAPGDRFRLCRSVRRKLRLDRVESALSRPGGAS